MTNKNVKKYCPSNKVDLERIASTDRVENASAMYHPTGMIPFAESVIILETILLKKTIKHDIKTYINIQNLSVSNLKKVIKEQKKLKHKVSTVIHTVR